MVSNELLHIQWPLGSLDGLMKCMCVCVYVYVRERDRERERECVPTCIEVHFELTAQR